MLPTEFYDLTKVTLDGDQYRKVETVYDIAKMQKAEFCKEWLKLRNSKLMSEIEEGVFALRNENNEMESEIRHLRNQLIEIKQLHNEDLEQQTRLAQEHLNDFARRIILAIEEGTNRVYDMVEEECGIGFIIKTKHEAGIPLSEDEIKYMVNKL